MKKGKSFGSGDKNKLRRVRVFSDTFKRQRVKEVNQGLYNVTEVSKLYGVAPTTVYRWLYKYSINHQKGVIQVVQMESEAHKNKLLLERLAELERIVGQKQLQIDYLEKLVQISSSELKVDIKKNFGTKSSLTSTALSSKKGSK